MSKSQFYLSECAQAAEKSPMGFKLGAVMVKGGKVISTGHNHHRPHYDGAEVPRHGHRKPVSMHAEMHAIFSLTGMSPSFKKQHGKSDVKDNTVYRSPKGTLAQSGVFHGPGPTKRALKSRAVKKYAKQKTTSSIMNVRGRGSKNSAPPTSESGSGSSAESSGSEDCRDPPVRTSSLDFSVPIDIGIKGARWDSRRRDSKMNGADLYVARITKNGCGNARPCWRCLEWCRWAGIKRIFHWNEVTNQFDVVKVNDLSADQYETHADHRLFAGLGW